MDKGEVERWRQRIREKIGPGSEAGMALEREQWELAAMHLLLAAIDLLEEMGAPALEALLDELELGLSPHQGSRARKRVGHGRAG